MNVLGFLLGALFFQSQWIKVPLDHQNPESRKISIEYMLTRPFDPDKKTIITHDDPFDYYFGLGDLLHLPSEDFNVIRIHGRYFSSDLQDFFDENPAITLENNYRWLSRYQVIQDLEWIRKEILGENPAILLGFGSSAGLIHYYLHEYPSHVEKVVSLNPFLLDIPKNLRFWNLLGGFEELIDNQSSELVLKFSTKSSEPYFFLDKSIRDSLFLKKFNEFNQDQNLNEPIFNSLGFTVRAFEHFIDMDKKNLGPLGEFLSQTSLELMEASSFEKSKIEGTNYDMGKMYSSKIIIIGGVYNLLLDPKSFDIIGEFYPNSNVFLLKDGFGFTETQGAGIWKELLITFCSENVQDQVQLYRRLQQLDLLFQEKNYNSIRVGK
ncbi:hypothetical protein [Algoriphagus sp.]|uniref:hypothetical protein n=1 Tax=Algoriphagus sp. TaxID=1872435 RepID=UPI0026060740|nr:hypothetical protein [Algoriphagus sp.]